MRTIDLMECDEMLGKLKEELEIFNTPQSISITLWHYKPGNIELEFRVAIFTTPGECKIGSGSSITAAINNCRAQLMPKTAKIEECESVKVEV